MPVHQETRQLPYTPEQMFAVVADIEHYPEFVPGCAELAVLEREKKNGQDILTAEMHVSYHGLRERYVSRVVLDRDAGIIEAHHVEGPFLKLETKWRFSPRNGGSEVLFHIDFAFHNRLLAAIAHLALESLAHHMADAFVKRADKLYGGSQQTL